VAIPFKGALIRRPATKYSSADVVRQNMPIKAYPMIDKTKKKALTHALGIPAKSASKSNNVNNTSPAKLVSNKRHGQ
jgi:hypothetical protein